MIHTYSEAIQELDKRSSATQANIRQSELQRRNKVVDNYGIEFTRQGVPGIPAEFEIPISPDLIYYERFQFKLTLHPFLATFGNLGTTTSVSLTATTSNTSLSGTVSGTNVTINPNPHNHSASISPASHNHQIAAGLTQVPMNLSGFKLEVEGFDITQAMYDQYPNIISTIGKYPNSDSSLDMYDMIKIVDEMPAWKRKIITTPGDKIFTMSAVEGYFNISMRLYTKYSLIGR